MTLCEPEHVWRDCDSAVRVCLCCGLTADRRSQPCSVTPCDCTGYQHTHDLHVTRTTHLTAREGR